MNTSVKHEVEQRGQALSGQEAADCLQLAHARYRLPGRARLEVGEWQPEEVMKQAPARVRRRSGWWCGSAYRCAETAGSSRTGRASPSRRPAPPASTCPCGPAPCRRRAGRRSASPARTAARTATPPAHGPADAGSAESRAGTSGSQRCWVDARPAEPAGDQDDQLARAQVCDVLDRKILRGAGDRIDQPRPTPRGSDAQHSEGAVLQADDRRQGRRGQVAWP